MWASPLLRHASTAARVSGRVHGVSGAVVRATLPRTSVRRLTRTRTVSQQHAQRQKQLQQLRARQQQQQQGEQVQGQQQRAMEYKGFLGMENNHAMYAILGLQGAVFLGWHASDNVDFMKKHFTLSVDNLRAGRLHTLVTSIFSHNDLTRLLANSVALFLVGAPAVATLGQPRFFMLYIGSGMLSAAAALAISSGSETARNAPKNTWRFGGNGSVLSVAAFAAMQNPIPIMAPALLLPSVVWVTSMMHNEGDYAHFFGLAVGAAFFVATKRFHPAWRQAVPKYQSR